MAAKTCKGRNGDVITDGEKVTLELAYDTESVKITGTVRFFEHVERVYDEEGIAIAKIGSPRWEITTDDPQHPAVGFLPGNVLTRTEA